MCCPCVIALLGGAKVGELLSTMMANGVRFTQPSFQLCSQVQLGFLGKLVSVVPVTLAVIGGAVDWKPRNCCTTLSS